MTEEQKDYPEENIVIVEKNVHRTILQSIIDTLCLLFPIASAFAGWLFSKPIWKVFSENKTVPELFKFGTAVIFFSAAASIVFIKTRKINPIMKIGIFSGKQRSQQPT